MSPTVRVGAALALGLVTGIFLNAVSHTAARHAVAVVEPVGALWVNGIRMTVIPLVVSMLVVGVAAPEATRGRSARGPRSRRFPPCSRVRRASFDSPSV